MRTTVTLDPDVEAALRRSMRENRVGFKQALNDAVRRGFSHQTQVHTEYTASRPMGTPTIDLSKALLLAASLEDDEIVRKMQAGK